MSVLVDPNLRVREERVKAEPFVEYATTSWPYHLICSVSTPDDELLRSLADFFNGPWVLRWICMLSYADQLQ
jgi:hypothetical protein